MYVSRRRQNRYLARLNIGVVDGDVRITIGTRLLMVET